ncbi:S-layer homology domain-containing protein [Paenibacillus sp. 19GGS1-52]|uniref:S-layer homology domain-containing protein n=1 Tax=Paenibacillus sp. 19GGS1-52 TaxID=2758563 RepID=UPI001EFA97E1|nr:S-layer homology domain-containing protein [Paenibacillus sp. 19GGS1-52]ULO06888.1 S-layer homology domain-containing protein [Paenibacillus sp. 19GGS1-52]
MKKYVAAILALLFMLSPVSGYAAASFTLNLSAKEVVRGDAMQISGTVASDANDVVIKIVRPNKTLLYIDAITPSNNSYATSVAIPTNEDFAPFGVYEVVVGSGNSTQTKQFSVVNPNGEVPVDPPATPTPTPTSTPPATGSNDGSVTVPASAAIPSDAGKAVDTILQPELAKDGRYLIGSETMAKAILQASISVTIELPVAASNSGSVLEFPTKSLVELKDKNLDLIIASGDRTVRFPAGSISATDELQSRIRLVLNTAWTDEAKSVVQQSLQSNSDYSSTGVILSVVIQVISGNKTLDIHNLVKPAIVTMKLTEEQGKLLSTDLAGVYYADGNKVEYVGGTLNSGTFTFTAEHFSYYTILEFNKTFIDLAGHWAEKSVKSLAAKHIANGVDEQHYEPNRSITRAEFTTMLMRTIGWTGKVSTEAAVNPFSDVAANQYYTEQVAAAASLGIVSGYGGTFRPNDKITREEAVVALVRAVQYFTLTESGKGEPSFTDVKEIAAWAAASVNKAWSQGLIQGDGTHFNPQKLLTRAEVAVMINRLLPNGSL